MIAATTFVLDPDYLESLATRYRQTYASAAPFPHIVIDDFLPEPWLDAVLAEFPKVHAIEWQSFDTQAEKKLASTAEQQMGPATRLLIYQLNSSTFINFLERLTAIQGLVPDPHLVGGGLHQIERGGFLKVHADFNWHERLRLDRRLNVIVYLNKNWRDEYGGHLQLWDREMTRCEARILPIYNRAVIFNTTDWGYHGHPDPLTCPPGETRKSIALYYYTNGRPEEESSGSHSTLFKARPGEEIQSTNKSEFQLKQVLEDLTPPLLARGLKRLRDGRHAKS